MATKKTIRTTPLAADHRKAGLWQSMAKTGWLVDMSLKGRGGADIEIFGSYEKDGDPDETAKEIFKRIGCAKRTFIWLADFNATPAEISGRPWLKALKATVMQPSDAQATVRARRAAHRLHGAL